VACYTSNSWAGGCLACQQESCDKTCSPEWVTEKISKSCFYTERKEICIPAVRFPWDKCCTPKCGKVITIKLLKKRKYKCEQCKVKWNIFGRGNSCTDCAPTSTPIFDPIQPTPVPGTQPVVPPTFPPAPAPAAEIEKTGMVRFVKRR